MFEAEFVERTTGGPRYAMTSNDSGVLHRICRAGTRVYAYARQEERNQTKMNKKMTQHEQKRLTFEQQALFFSKSFVHRPLCAGCKHALISTRWLSNKLGGRRRHLAFIKRIFPMPSAGQTHSGATSPISQILLTSNFTLARF